MNPNRIDENQKYVCITSKYVVNLMNRQYEHWLNLYICSLEHRSHHLKQYQNDLLIIESNHKKEGKTLEILQRIVQMVKRICDLNLPLAHSM